MTWFVRGRLRVTHPETYRATSVRTRPRSIDGVGSEDVDQILADSLRRNGFTQVQRVRLSPRLRGGGATMAAQPMVSLALDLAGAEDAVVLTEAAGCYRWVRPRHEGSRDDGGSRTAVFDIVVPTPPGAMRATVLSYAWPSSGGAAIGALETFVQAGLVHVTAPDLGQWQRADRLDELGLDPGRANRVLLLVHGTFDSTAGAFGGLAATGDGRAFLASAVADYDAVVGFDHRTLSLDPLANAQDLAERLSAFQATQQVSLDVICHSRGGLTARSLAESVLPGLAWRGRVDRVVFVAATNAGTHFADAARWGDLADVYTNLVAANARAVADLPGGGPVAEVVVDAVRGVGVLVKWLASFATDPDTVPGIAAMVPGGPFVTALNTDQPGQPRPGTPWLVVSSDFEPTVLDHPPEMPVAVVTRIVDGIVDQVIQGPNDLVVDVASMSAVDLPHGGGYIRDSLALGTNATVYHTNYFIQPVVCRALSAWLVERVDRVDEGTTSTGPVSDGPTTRQPRAPGRGADATEESGAEQLG